MNSRQKVATEVMQVLKSINGLDEHAMCRKNGKEMKKSHVNDG